MAVLPMFPLGCVLMPGGILPLHVFEPRYRQLVQDCLDQPNHEFGVVLIERGHEVGGGDQRCSVGVIAKMLQVGQMDDGRYAMVTVGTRRFRVNAWLPDDPYPLADVDELPDDGALPTADAVALVHQRVRRCAALASELGDSVAIDPDISDDLLLASYQLSASAPLGAADQQQLLCCEGPAARIEMLAEMLDTVEELQQFRLAEDAPAQDWTL
jgi:uncharacterized protein